MPCISEGPDDAFLEVSRNLRETRAMLCGIVHALKEDDNLESYLQHVNWKEAGVTRQDFDKWWAQHQKIDNERRAREAQKLKDKKKRERLSKVAYGSLTKEEKRFLKRFEDDEE